MAVSEQAFDRSPLLCSLSLLLSLYLISAKDTWENIRELAAGTSAHHKQSTRSSIFETTHPSTRLFLPRLNNDQ
jgi:hypothetical protein